MGRAVRQLTKSIRDHLLREMGRLDNDTCNCFCPTCHPLSQFIIRYGRVRHLGATNSCGFRDPLVHRPSRVLERFSSGSRKTSSAVLN